MADNIAITPGSGAIVAADDVGGVAYQRVKLVDSTADSATPTGVAASPLQVSLANHAANTVAVKVDGSAATQPVSGSVTATLSAETTKVIGTVNISASQTVATVTTVSTLTGGSIASDGVDSGNPIKTGAKAIANLSAVTLVADADRVNNVADLDGAQIIRNVPLGDLVSGNASNTDGTSTQLIAAQAAGIKTYITDITITNTSSSNIYVELKDNTTVKWTFPVPANSGVVKTFASPLAGTAATAWNFDPSAAASTVYCSASGFKSKI